MQRRIHETTMNTHLRDVLWTKNPSWHDCMEAENMGVIQENSQLRLDILMLHTGGLPVVIETEYDSSPASSVERDALDRLGKTLSEDCGKHSGKRIEQAIALRIPKDLKTKRQTDISKKLEAAHYKYCVYSVPSKDDGGIEYVRWPEKGWIKGGIDDVASLIEHTSLSEDRIEEGMNALEKGVDAAADQLRALCKNSPRVLKEIAEKLHQEDGEQTSRMAMAIILNALSFHISIARSEGAEDIEALDELKVDGKLQKGKLLNTWGRIRKINYRPIFKIAAEILMPIRNGVAQQILDSLAIVAGRLDSIGVTTQQDMSGRMFQRLITDRKFLATFYTLPSSAAMLAELAVSRLRDRIDWTDESTIKKLKVADFACGTGALLNATYGAMMSRYRRKGGRDSDLHSHMMEEVLVGTDIMPAATHLTTSVLSSAHPTEKFGKTNIWTLPYGEVEDETGKPIFIGALDLIGHDKANTLFGGSHQERVDGSDENDSDLEEVFVPAESFDLVIMNPPFTRSTGQEAEKVGVPVPMFAGFGKTEDEQRLMSEELTKVYRRRDRREKAGHGNAGLATNFMDIADEKLKDGGVLALIVLATFVSGKSWSGMREILEKRYRDITVVSIVGKNNEVTNFSADTGLSEVLIVATREMNEKKCNTPVTYIDLFRPPSSILEAVEFGKTCGKISSKENKEGIMQIADHENIGRYSKTESGFATSSGVENPAVANAASTLERGFLKLPQLEKDIELPVAELGDIGKRGRYHQDIDGSEPTKRGPRGPFERIVLDPGGIPEYPMLWNHHAKDGRENRLVVQPDWQGNIRDGQDDRARALWKETASRLCFNRDFRLTSQSLAACITPMPVIGGAGWPGIKLEIEDYQYPIVLWMNTTLGLISFWWAGTRQSNGRSRLSISKLPTLPILDVRTLSESQIQLAKDIFEKFESEILLPANRASEDDVRKALDEEVLVNLLGLPSNILPSLGLLREMWCSEPSLDRK